MLGMKILPNCLDSHEKESASIFECCLTKRDQVWVSELMLIMLKTSLFPKVVDFSLLMHSFGFLFFVFWKKENKIRGKLGRWMKWLPPYFCTYLFIVIYYDSSAETLLWDQIQGRAQISPHCTVLKIWLSISIYLNAFLWAACPLLAILPRMHSLHI